MANDESVPPTLSLVNDRAGMGGPLPQPGCLGLGITGPSFGTSELKIGIEFCFITRCPIAEFSSGTPDAGIRCSRK